MITETHIWVLVTKRKQQSTRSNQKQMQAAASKLNTPFLNIPPMCSAVRQQNATERSSSVAMVSSKRDIS